MTTDDDQPALWHDLIHPAPPATSATTAPPTAARPRAAITPRRDASRRSAQPCPNRRLTRRAIENGVSAGFHAAPAMFLIWLATEAAPHDTGLAAAIAAIAAWCTLGALTHTVTAAIAIRSRHHQPTTALATTATWLIRLHLCAACATVPAAAVYNPIAVPAALTVLFAATFSWLLLVETRDTITGHRQHTHDIRCQPTDRSTTRRSPPHRTSDELHPDI
ncbi:hypothetical protein [Actinoplanes sp. GCM10030250]|uniref:hypothetical protein n=1 Tax=Actinoplanes sp. GCM10030250 TaxID=3273376 RepID=UPI0036086149